MSFVKVTLPMVLKSPYELIDLSIKIAYDGLQPELTNFLKKSNPDWIIYDFTAYWLPLPHMNIIFTKHFIPP